MFVADFVAFLHHETVFSDERVIFFCSVFFRLSHLQRLVSSFDLSISSVDSTFLSIRPRKMWAQCVKDTQDEDIGRQFP